MIEVWKDIKGYEGLYQVSNLGRVKSLSRKVNDFRGKDTRTMRERIMKQRIRNTYYIVQLKKDGTRKTCQVHRIVGVMFIPNPDNKPVINHLDYNPKNNRVDNLAWCTQKENINYSIDRMKHRKSVTHTNTGERYIYYRKSNGMYRVVIDKKEYSSFKTLEEAIKKRNEILNEQI